jgi:hypothetical protein
MDFKNPKNKNREPKSRYFFQMFVIFKKKTVPSKGTYGLKNLKKIYSQAYGFLCFVIFIQVLHVDEIPLA